MKTGLLILLIICLSGCVGNEKRRANNAKFQSTIPTCDSERECEFKWSAARRWVLQNAGMKLQHVTPDFLETYNSAGSTVNLAVRVVKEPMYNGKGYRLIVTTWCSNLFGCNPDAQEAAQNFNDTINAVKLPDF